jgi:hypothetical protein
MGLLALAQPQTLFRAMSLRTQARTGLDAFAAIGFPDRLISLDVRFFTVRGDRF